MKKHLLALYKKMNKSMAIPYSKDERYLIMIVCRLLKDETSELTMQPSMTEFYIRTRNHQYTIVLDFATDYAQVYNHKFGYNIKMSQRLSSFLYKAYIKECTKRRNEMIAEVRNNIQFSLHSVVNGISQETGGKCVQDIQSIDVDNELEKMI